MEFEITLNDLVFYSYIGVLEEEKKIGNEFRVSVSVFLPYKEEILNDNISSTVSYAELYDIVHKQMQIEYNLLEKVAAEIAKSIKYRYPQISRGKVSIEKKHPPIPGMIGSAIVALNF